MEAARLAEAADVSEMAAVAGRVRDELEPGRGGVLFLAREAGPWPFDDRVHSIIDSDRAIAVVGTYDDVIFGYGLAVLEEMRDGRLLGVIEDLAVDEQARKSGIGEAMMNLILDGLTEAGCVGVDSRALPGDRHTKNFFESFGLKARLLTVHRVLDGDTGSP